MGRGSLPHGRPRCCCGAWCGATWPARRAAAWSVEDRCAHPAAASQPPVAKRARRDSWTDAEDAALLEHIAKFGPRHWDRCARAMGSGRTARAVSARWLQDLQGTERGRAALSRAPVAPIVCATWTDAEDEAVLEHFAQFGEGEWDQCARAMGSGRTAAAVATRWGTIICKTERGCAALACAPISPRVRVRWTDAEDAAILEHVAQFGLREWQRCVDAMGTGRTANTAHCRWRDHLNETDLGRAALARAPVAPRVRARWTDADDAVLLEHVAQFGRREWDHCAVTMGAGRTAMAVRDRWEKLLRDTDHGRAALSRAPAAQLGVRWTDAEDEALFKHVAEHDTGDWERCAQAIGTGRSARAVEDRWHRHLRDAVGGALWM